MDAEAVECMRDYIVGLTPIVDLGPRCPVEGCKISQFLSAAPNLKTGRMHAGSTSALPC